MKTTTNILASLVLLAAALPLSAHAAVNRCLDSNGNILITDEPCSNSGRIQVVDLTPPDASVGNYWRSNYAGANYAGNGGDSESFAQRFWDARPIKASTRIPRRNIVAPGTSAAVPPLPPAPGMKAWPPWRNPI